MVAEKGADLVKELWLQDNVVRAETAGTNIGSSGDSLSTGYSTTDFSGYESNRINVIANATET